MNQNNPPQFPDEPLRKPSVPRTISLMYEGPVPPPQVIEAYQRLLPNAAERLFTQWEKQTDSRIKLQEAEQSHDHKQEARGQWMGFALAFLVLTSSVVLIFFNKPIMGISTLVTAVATLVSVYVYKIRTEAKKK